MYFSIKISFDLNLTITLIDIKAFTLYLSHIYTDLLRDKLSLLIVISRYS